MNEGNLTKESLQILVVEIKTIANSGPLTTEVMNDVTSLAPLGPIKILLMKSRVVMPHLGNFTAPHKYSRKQLTVQRRE